MKKRRGIKIYFTNRWLYTFIVIGILIAIGVGVYAATYTASGAGHPYTEISTCDANQILKMSSDGTAWACGTDLDTDTKGSLSCTTRSATTGTSCNTLCSNNGEICTSAAEASGGRGYTCEGTTAVSSSRMCRCCKIV